MNRFSFRYMDRCKLENFLPQMFEILYSNMSVIAPTNNSYASDFQIWMSHIVPALQESHRETILVYVDCEFVGYFRYSLNNSTQSFLIEDVQIRPAFQGIGIFTSCLKWLVVQLPGNIPSVEAYVDKRNDRSRAVMEHLGLKCEGENKNGISLYLKSEYSEFYNRLL